ncbi:hypothetical protein NCAS_0C01830 [Naumovozyma castellii]|uniref:ABC1 atypical kinase-like domain-containing protein n=1 Tax=Naumovozyma castellii TaxID=27288 RepID=G0VCG3_NAUCA|nr:hypothetical protein NCAS_0C01830 [Naumovozyma castellii CBS 4309]CCC69173.1 hypothetical protein NCAS_0C01830 [Naumovozyma castellii CBS 4309]
MFQLRHSATHSWRFFYQSARTRTFNISLRHLIVPPSLGIIYYNTTLSHNRSLIFNDKRLKPDPNGDTFEMGLYLSSQRELQDQRQTALRNSSSIFTRITRQIWFQITDHVIEPILTILRFLELSTLFLPLLILYPITYCGPMTSEGRGPSGFIVWARLLKQVLEWAGPSFIKLGQWASSRNDIFDKVLCEQLGSLHSNVRPHSLQYTRETVCKVLKVEHFDDVFEEFQEVPLGVGAIAQVYVGKLSSSFMDQQQYNLPLETNWCAMKIIHPRVRKQIDRDLKIMRFFATIIDNIPTMEWISLPNEVENFTILMRLQLDLRIEALNLERFNKNFENSIQVKFPEVMLPLYHRNILFEEYIGGFPMENFLKIKNKLNDDELCKNVSDPFVDAFLKMLILDDFIHADLHPGNVMLRFVKTNRYDTEIISSEEESFRITHSLRKKYNANDPNFIEEMRYTLQNYMPQICFIDTGLITELNDKNRVNFIDLFNALARFDGYRAGELMIERSRTPETAINKELFAAKVEKLTDTVKKRTFTLGTVSIGDLLDQMLSMVRYHHVRMEGDFVSVVVAILLLEGIGRQLDPDMDLFARFVSFVLIFGFDNSVY